jgi:hypothetical protein
MKPFRRTAGAIVAIAAAAALSGCGAIGAAHAETVGSLPPGSPCTNSWDCAGDNYCLGSPSQCRPLSRAPANARYSVPTATPQQTTPTPAGAQVSAEKQTGTQATGTTNVDPRLGELQTSYAALLEQARAHKITYLKAARLYREKFVQLFPEVVSNDLMNEYLAYMATVGERIDKKKLTEAEAEYELARKMSELKDRALAREAPRREEAARRASDEAARAEQEQWRIAQERGLAERRAAQERALAQQRDLAAQAVAQAAAQAEKERRLRESQDMMMTGLQILLGPRPAPVQNCTGRWIGQNWVQSCY